MENLTKKSTYCALLFIGMFLFSVQARVSSFMPGHHGWVSSHNLVIAANGTMDTGYVGHTKKMLTNGKKSYWYFARSPIFTYLIIKLSDSFTSNLEVQVILARYLTLTIFFITFLLSFFLLYKVLASNMLALSATLLAYSAQIFTFYNDQIAPEMFTNLGFLLAIYGVYFIDLKKRNFIGIILIFLSINLGWGYSQLPILGLWCLYKLYKHGSILKMFKEKAVYITLFAIVYLAGNIVYNAHQEAKLRGVPLGEAGIFSSAKSRLGVNSKTNHKFSSYPDHFLKQISRIAEHVQQFKYKSAHKSEFKYLKKVNYVRLPIMVIFLFTGLFLYFKKRRKKILKSNEMNYIFLLLALSGFAWLLPMKNLALPHHYTTVVYFGFYLFLYSYVVKGFGEKLKVPVLIFSIIVFIATHSISSYTKNKASSYSHQTLVDASKIRMHLKNYSSAALCYEKKRSIFPGVPYAMDYIFNTHFTAPMDQCDFLITTNRVYKDDSLVSTKELFLVKLRM